MAGKRYSAGRVFLQVVPSFDNFQKAVRREVEREDGPLQKQAEEMGRRQEEARNRGASKARKANATAEQRDAVRTQAERVKQFQRFSQGMVESRIREGERVRKIEEKERRDREKSAERSAANLVKLGIRLGQGDIRAEQERTKAAQREADQRAKIRKQEADDYLRTWQARLKQRVAESIKADEAERAAEQKRQQESDRAHEAARKQFQRDTDFANRENQKRLDAERKANKLIDAERRRLAGGRYGQQFRQGTKEAADSIGIVKVDANTSEAERKLLAIREELLALHDANVGVDLDTGEARAKIKLLETQLNHLARKSPSIDVDVRIAGALMGLKAIEHQAEKTNRKLVMGGMLSSMLGLKSSAEDGANSFRVFNLAVAGVLALLPMLPALLASAAAGIAALGTAAIGGAAGLGVMILGLSGIGNALQAMMAVQDNAQAENLANEKAMRRAAKTVRDAEQGVTRARESAARATEDASRRVAQARRSLGDTEARVAKSIQSALRQQQDAETRLADAQKAATDAQNELMRARQTAQDKQQELADRIKSGQLDERQALIDLFNAQVDYNAAMADGSATNLDREQATIALERAQIAIRGVRRENKALAAEQKSGGQAAKDIADAQEKVASTQKDVKNAQQDAADADANTREARIQGARDIADAQQGVTDALRDQRRTAEDNAIAIRDANERLSDAQAAYQEALTKTGDIGQSSMDKLRTAMGKLSPAGQDFANYLFSLYPMFLKLRGIAETGMLPGFTEAIKLIVTTYGPGFAKFIGSMAKAVGDFAVLFAKALTGPTMKTFFDTMAVFGPTFFSQWGKLAIELMKLFAGLATAFAPFAKDFMDGFIQMAAGWADWAAGLKDDPAFQNFLGYVKKEGPKVLRLLGDLLTIVWNIGKGLSESGMFDGIVNFFDTLAGFDPKVLSSIAVGILGLMVASQVSAGLNSLVISLQLLVTTPVGLITLAVIALVAGLIILYNKSEWFRNFVDNLWTNVQGYIATFVDWVKAEVVPWFRDEFMPVLTDVFNVVGSVLLWVWNTILKPVFTLLGQIVVKVFTIAWLAWKNILWPMFKLFWEGVKYLAKVTEPIWRGIGTVVENLFSSISDMWDKFGAPFFDAIIQLLTGDFAGAWETAVKMASTVWNELGKIVATPVNFIIGTVLNDGLYKGINNVLEFLGLSWRIPMGKLIQVNRADPHFNYTGVASKGSAKKNKYAFASGGVMPGYSPGRDIHTFYSPTGGRLDLSGGEAIMRPEFTRAVGGEAGIHLLNAMARMGKLPWQQFALGGMVKPVNAKPGFAWGHYPSGKLHRALDFPVPIGTPVVSPFSGNIIKDGWDTTGYGTSVRLAADNGTFWILGHMLREIVSVGQRVLGGQLLGYSGNSGNSTGPHLHLAGRMRPYDDSSAFDFTALWNGGQIRTPFVGKSGGAGDLPWWADKPLEMLRGLVNTGISMIPFHGGFIDMLKGFPNKIFDGAKAFLADHLGGDAPGTDSASGGAIRTERGTVPYNGAMMYDSGGYLQPGVTTVLNMTGRPEPVFTADQMSRGTVGARGALIGSYAPTFQASDLTADDVAASLIYELDRAMHGGKYAGV